MAKPVCKSVAGVLNFHLLPKDIKIKSSHPKIKLDAIPSPPFSAPCAAYIGAVQDDNKKKFKINSQLKKLLKQISMEESQLAPVKEYLKQTLIMSQKNPTWIVGILDSFLKSGSIANFTLIYSLAPVAPVGQTVQVDIVSQPVQSLNFELITREVKTKDSKVKVKLDAILTSPLFSADAKMSASIRYGKKNFKISNQLNQVLQQIGWDAAALTPLKSYLSTMLKTSSQNPELPVGILSTYLQGGGSPAYLVNKPATAP
jgi:hypothetical protein